MILRTKVSLPLHTQFIPRGKGYEQTRGMRRHGQKRQEATQQKSEIPLTCDGKLLHVVMWRRPTQFKRCCIQGVFVRWLSTVMCIRWSVPLVWEVEATRCICERPTSKQNLEGGCSRTGPRLQRMLGAPPWERSWGYSNVTCWKWPLVKSGEQPVEGTTEELSIQ